MRAQSVFLQDFSIQEFC